MRRAPLKEDELRTFVELWMNGTSRQSIAETLQISIHSVSVLASELRREGVSLPRRNTGERAGRTSRAEFINELRDLVGAPSSAN